jgi:hypothetical protein
MISFRMRDIENARINMMIRINAFWFASFGLHACAMSRHDGENLVFPFSRE